MAIKKLNLFHLAMLSLVSSVIACSSTSKTGKSPVSENIISPKCETTPIQISDLERLGFAASPGKVVVVRLFRVSCPFCKEDLLRIGSLFQNGTWTKENVQLFLIAYKKEGIEDRKTFSLFMREELPHLGIPLEAAQVVYLDKNYDSLIKTKGAKGELLFEGWRAVPFGLVFAKNGRLTYRGHFTTSIGIEDEHYRFITDLQKESCPLKVQP